MMTLLISLSRVFPRQLFLPAPGSRHRRICARPNICVKACPHSLPLQGGADHAIPVLEMVEFHQALKAKSIPSELYIGNKGKHGFCNGRNPYNRFFYWSINLADQFLVKHGILDGASMVLIPKIEKGFGSSLKEVRELAESKYQSFL